MREHWADLNGPWDFEYGDGDDFGRTITVPFPPESKASGIGDQGFHPVLRYRRRITAEDLGRAGHATGRILLLHFGAVDYRADVWVDGRHALTHEGGSTPFVVEVPGECSIVVRAWDDPHDLTQPRGKQDWELDPHVIWYPRTSGIWQGVWLESVPAASIRSVAWALDVDRASTALTVGVAGAAAAVRVAVRLGDELLATVSSAVDRGTCRLIIPLPALRNGQDTGRLLWSPEHPVLLDAVIELLDEHGAVLDEVGSLPRAPLAGGGGWRVPAQRPAAPDRWSALTGVLARVAPGGTERRRPEGRGAAHQGPGLRRLRASTRRSRTRGSCSGPTASDSWCGPSCRVPTCSTRSRRSG